MPTHAVTHEHAPSGQIQRVGGSSSASGAFSIWDLVAYAPSVASVPAVALGVAGLAGVGPQLLRSRPLLSSLLVAGGVFGLVHWQLERLFSEEPDFTLEERIDELEIRRYGSRIVAETTVFPAADDGDEAFEQALSEGFKRLAGYIFRGNASEEKIAMTLPTPYPLSGELMKPTSFAAQRKANRSSQPPIAE